MLEVLHLEQTNLNCVLKRKKIVCKSCVCLDVQTRWNSTYFILDSALKFQEASERLEQDDSEFVTNLYDGAPTFEDWSKAHVLVKFLRIFYETTKKLSGSLYVTSTLHLEQVFLIHSTLNGWTNSS